MEYKIALLLKEHYRKHAGEWQKELPPDIKAEFIPYGTFEELEDAFYSLRDKVDGIYVSGIMPYHALRLLMKDEVEPPLVYSPIDMENTYRVLLQKMVSSRRQSLSRVGMDFLRGNSDLEDLIMTGKFADAVHSYEERWEQRNTVAEIDEEEKAINRYYLEQCKENKFDMVVTYFYSVVETLKDFDVECFYVYPSAQAFARLIDGLKNSISLHNMRNKIPAVISIDTGGDEEQSNEIMKAMEVFNRNHLNRLMLKESYMDLEYITDYEFVRTITDDFMSCPIGEWLKQQTGFTGSVGYGIGSNVYQARLNAIDAFHYGRNIKSQSGSSVLIDEKDRLTVLRKEGTESVISASESYVSEIANKVKLSSETILKIMGIMQASGSEEITSQELMDALKISLRTANKFLSNLEKYGYAEVTGLKRSGNKGRPINVYRIKIRI